MPRPAGRDTFSARIIAQIYTMMTQIIYPVIDVRIRFSLLPSHICVEKQLQFSPLEEWMKGLGYCCSKRRTKGFLVCKARNGQKVEAEPSGGRPATMKPRTSNGALFCSLFSCF